MHPLHALRGQRWFRAVSHLLDRPVFRRVNGVRMCLRLGPHISLILGKDPEPVTRAAFRRLVADTGAKVFWDIGANAGLFCVDFLRCGGTSAVAMEPDTRNAAVLQVTIAHNALPVRLICAAASDRKGTARFHVDDLSGHTGTLMDETFNARNYGVESAVVTVPTIRLDDLAESCPQPDIVKIDVEGAELEVLEGGRGLLTHRRPALVIEISRRHEAIIALLEGCGYTVNLLAEGNYIARAAEIPQTSPTPA